MKLKTINLRWIMVVSALCMTLAVSAQQLNEAQSKAQKSLIEYLKEYNPSIDTHDQSVCFKVNNQLYWIDIKGKSSPLLYTLNTKGMKLSGTPSEIARKREDAQIATNTVNAKSRAKTYVDGDQVVFCFPMYAAYPEDIQRCIKAGIMDLAELHDTFLAAYKDAAKVSKKRHDYWYDLDTTCVIITQPVTNVAEVNQRDNNGYSISDFDIRNVDINGDVITNWGSNLRRSEVKFLQPLVILEPADPKFEGTVKIAVKIYNPQGKLMLPSKGVPFTTVSYGSVNKKDKDIKKVVLNKFGSNNSDIWTPGEYTIEFWDDNQLLKKSTFNIL